jgi:hypothetical protein
MNVPDLSFWAEFKKTNGAFSTVEAIALYNICLQVPEGDYAELGVYKGKSAMIAAAGLPPGIFTLIEPEFSDKEWDDEVFQKVSAINPNVLVQTLNEYSTDIIPDMGPMAYVFVDSGSHQDGLPMQEVKLLEDKMVQGGVIAFHDWDSQFKEVKEASDYLVSTGKYEYVPIDWSGIIAYAKANDLENGNTSWHHNELDFPCFLGAVKRK